MEFNLNKCKVMHIGHGNRNSMFYMGEVELGVFKEEKDLGIIVSNTHWLTRRSPLNWEVPLINGLLGKKQTAYFNSQ